MHFDRFYYFAGLENEFFKASFFYHSKLDSHIVNKIWILCMHGKRRIEYNPILLYWEGLTRLNTMDHEKQKIERMLKYTETLILQLIQKSIWDVHTEWIIKFKFCACMKNEGLSIIQCSYTERSSHDWISCIHEKNGLSIS